MPPTSSQTIATLTDLLTQPITAGYPLPAVPWMPDGGTRINNKARYCSMAIADLWGLGAELSCRPSMEGLR